MFMLLICDVNLRTWLKCSFLKVARDSFLIDLKEISECILSTNMSKGVKISAVSNDTFKSSGHDFSRVRD